MRISLVLLLCFLIVMVNSAKTKVTRRRVISTTGQNSTKASTPKSAYAYLRNVRGKNSCTGRSCPFWERHGRSFAALRCYAQQYQECTCLHRMCFSSCMFTRPVCNEEMVSCLRQICPRCMPPSASAMCAVYDSLAVQVANALSVFACYPCCPIINNVGINNNTTGNSATQTTTMIEPESSSITPFITTNGVFMTNLPGTEPLGEGEFNGGEYPSGTGEEVLPGTNQNVGTFPSNNGNGGAYTNVNGNGIPNSNGNGFINGNGNGIPNSNGNSFINGNGNGIPNSNGNGFINGNGNGIPNSNGNGFVNANGNGIPNSNGNGFINGNGNGIPNSNGNGFVNANGNGIPNSNGNGFINGNGNGNGISNGNGNNVANGNGNGNGNGISGNCNIPNNYPGIVFPGSDLMFYNNNFPLRSQQTLKQRVRQTIPTTKRRLSTIRRTPVTSPRTQGVATIRGNKVNSSVRKPVQTQKKPQTNNRTKS